MKIVIAATPATGHVNPVLGAARTLVDQGHEVHVFTGQAFRARVESVGARLHPLPASADFDALDLDGSFPGRAGLTGMDVFNFDFKHIFFGNLAAQYRGLQALIAEIGPDAIIADAFFFGIVPLMLQPRERRPIVAICGVTFLGLPRADGLPHGPGLPFVDAGARPGQAAEMRAGAEAAMRPVQELYEAALRDVGVEPVGLALGVTTSHSDIFWQGGVPELEYPQSNLPPHLSFAGLWPATPAPVPPPEWAEDLDGARHVVFVTQGTVANGDLDKLVLSTMRALADRDDVLVVGTAGGRDPGALAAGIPANARLATYLPLDWLLPRIDAMVTNGGFGTVIQALAAGVPLVVAGATEDKPEVAARVARSGAGIDLKTERPDDAMLRSAVDALLYTPGHSAAAAGLKHAFARLDASRIITGQLLRAVTARRDADMQEPVAAE
ncbi:UDP:flavonoid glycosyltransferase YjiC (YdhE family) [Sphingomonas zeicaulis]|uniref:glycosyltransferase n=1 Tax=Sphingomonas zeicaulis TaxID=1632740 RepID=UPI003D1EF426